MDSDLALILVATRDPISKLTQLLIGDKYTNVGFVFSSSAQNGVNNKQIIIFEYVTSNVPDYIYPTDTLSDLLNNPIVEKVKIKPIIDVSISKDKVQEYFKSSLLEHMNLSTRSNHKIKDNLYNLFHIEQDNSGIVLVKNILRKFESYFELDNNLVECLKMDQINHDIKESYDLASPLFPGPWIKIKNLGIPINKSNMHLLTSIKSRQKETLNLYFSSFIDLILHDTNFLSSLNLGTPRNGISYNSGQSDNGISYNSGIPYTYKNLYKHNHIARELITFLGYTNIEFQELFKDWLQNGSVLYSRVEKLIDKISKGDEIINSWLNSTLISDEFESESELDLESKGKSELKRKFEYFILPQIIPERDLHIINDKIHNKESIHNNETKSNTLFDALSDLHSQISEIKTSVLSNKMAKLKLNSLISSVNTITKLTGIKLDKIEPILSPHSSHLSHPSQSNVSLEAILVINTNDSLVDTNLVLNSGKKIILTTITSDDKLKQFSNAELMEILELMDISISSDSRFDLLRGKIASKLGKR